jgi:L-serine dehydratase
MKKTFIESSIFDLFKIGPGPSSSHTIGPMKAAYQFLQSINNLSDEKIKNVKKIKVHLYGSLSATGRGHYTDHAVLAGLLSWRPATCDSREFTRLFSKKNKQYYIKIKDKSLAFRHEDIIFDKIEHSFPFQNTIVFKLFSKRGSISEKRYYSIGGGFIKCMGEKKPKLPPPIYKYSNMKELIDITYKHRISLGDVVLANEEAITGRPRKLILKDVRNIISTMLESVERGIRAKGVLPGPIGLARKAHTLIKKKDIIERSSTQRILLLSAYSMAASEENASYHKVVTAPTSGSCGVIPGILYMLKNHLNISMHKLCKGMFAANAIGFIVKHNASISGAEVGCQGEIGVASSMAAALLAYINTKDIRRVSNAAEIALEHCLGWTCDPIGGYVQIPCIERNAIGAVHAVNAYVLAMVADVDKQKIKFDEVVEAMYETGHDMSTKYKETSEGGLAVCTTVC